MGPAIDQRQAVVGQNGTGKSTFSAQVLPRSGRLAILDPKRQFKYPVKIYERIAQIEREKPDRFMYRPDPAEFGSLDCMNRFFKYCYGDPKKLKSSIVIYIDDVVGVIENQRVPHYLRICYQMGRARDIAIIATMQRPTSVPLIMLTECVKIVAFRLTEPLDIRRIRAMCPGYDPDFLASLNDPYVFAYCDRNTMSCCTYHKIDPSTL